MTPDITASPLTWPIPWPRTPAGKRHRAAFYTNGPRGKERHSISEATRFIRSELALLGARDVVISTNLDLRLDGLPRSGQKAPEDPGASVWFTLRGAPRVLACDRWTRVEDNLWAVAKHIEALRGQTRWGVGTLDQAFTGYPALPQPASAWWQVLGVDSNAGLPEIQSAFRRLAKLHHPDHGGDAADFQRIQEAFEAGQAARKTI